VLRHTFTRVCGRFILDDTLPERLLVHDTAEPKSKTRTYSVVADYGWAEKILCSGSYRRDANDIAETVGEFLDIPVERAED
jgi:hypothetical protein